MKAFILTATFLLSFTAFGKSLNYECLGDGKVHKVNLISGRLHIDRNVVKLNDGREFKFKGKPKIEVDPTLYILNGYHVIEKGTFAVQKNSKSRGLGFFNNQTNTRTLYLDEQVQKGLNGKVIFQISFSTSSFVGAFFGAGGSSGVNTLEMDCHRTN